MLRERKFVFTLKVHKAPRHMTSLVNHNIMFFHLFESSKKTCSLHVCFGCYELFSAVLIIRSSSYDGHVNNSKQAYTVVAKTDIEASAPIKSLFAPAEAAS